MRIWLATEAQAAWPEQAPLKYSQAKIRYSGKNPWASATAVNDQILPTSSRDNETPRFLWDKTPGAPTGAGELESDQAESNLSDGVRWLQYDFPRPVTISSSSVYWVTNDRGTWTLPTAYRLFYREGNDWLPIKTDPPAPKADELQSFEFVPVTTSSVRLEVIPRKNKTVGVMEWAVK